MNLSREEAAAALGEIETAKVRATRLRGYRYGAPYAMLWGGLWIVANLTTHYSWKLGNQVWMWGILVIALASAFIGMRQGKDRSRMTEEERAKWKSLGVKAIASNVLTIGFFIAFFSILAPFDVREYNAGISLIAMFAYALMGIWIGWRLLVIASVGAAVILFAYFRVGDAFNLWMGFGAGGALFLGGLWMWKA